MPTRGGEAQARASPDTVLFPLPRCFVRAMFFLLPVDTRLRCSEVSRAWRALLADTTFWSRLDLSLSSGCFGGGAGVGGGGGGGGGDGGDGQEVAGGLQPFSVPLLRAAVAKAGGHLRALDITGQAFASYTCFIPFLLEVIAANSATLTELRMAVAHVLFAQVVRPLLEAPSALRLLEASVVNTDRHLARAMLRNEPPFQALRLQLLVMLHCLDAANVGAGAFSSDLSCHASLKELALCFAKLDSAAAMGAVVDACIALRLRTLSLSGCRVAPGALQELTRLVAAGSLRKLIVTNERMGDEGVVFDEAPESTHLFAAAVRASTLTELVFYNFEDPPTDVVEAAAFINARRR